MPEMRVCEACAIPQPVENFIRRGKKLRTCKACRLLDQIAKRKRDLDKILRARAELEKKYREREREKIK